MNRQLSYGEKLNNAFSIIHEENFDEFYDGDEDIPKEIEPKTNLEFEYADNYSTPPVDYNMKTKKWERTY